MKLKGENMGRKKNKFNELEGGNANKSYFDALPQLKLEMGYWLELLTFLSVCKHVLNSIKCWSLCFCKYGWGLFRNYVQTRSTYSSKAQCHRDLKFPASLDGQ